MSINVVIADDHEVVRSGVSTLLEGGEIDVVGEAADGDQAVEAVSEHHPDVVLMDIRMTESDGLDALKRIRADSPETAVVMFSTYDNPTYVARAIAMGANDYVLKGSPREQLLSAIRRAAAGEAPPEDSLINQIKGAMTRRHERTDDVPVTNRELQVLRHIALGLSNKEIGKSLGISVETVKEHVQNILRKINAVDRTQAAVWAVKKGLV